MVERVNIQYNNTIVVCGGWGPDNLVDSCEQLSLHDNGLPAALQWVQFAPLPSAGAGGCMMVVDGVVSFQQRRYNLEHCSCTIAVVQPMATTT